MNCWPTQSRDLEAAGMLPAGLSPLKDASRMHISSPSISEKHIFQSKQERYLLTQTPRSADCLVCLISISCLTDSQNLDMILSPRIWKRNNQIGHPDIAFQFKTGFIFLVKIKIIIKKAKVMVNKNSRIYFKKADTVTISCRGGRLWVISVHGQCVASWVTPTSHLSLAVMCKEHEKDQRAPKPSKYGDMINKLFENYHNIIAFFPLLKAYKDFPTQEPMMQVLLTKQIPTF